MNHTHTSPEDDLRAWGATLDTSAPFAQDIALEATAAHNLSDWFALLCAAILCGGLSMLAYTTTLDVERAQLLLTF